MSDSPTQPPGADDEACERYLETVRTHGEWRAGLLNLMAIIKGKADPDSRAP